MLKASKFIHLKKYEKYLCSDFTANKSMHFEPVHKVFLN